MCLKENPAGKKHPVGLSPADALCGRIIRGRAAFDIREQVRFVQRTKRNARSSVCDCARGRSERHGRPRKLFGRGRVHARQRVGKRTAISGVATGPRDKSAISRLPCYMSRFVHAATKTQSEAALHRQGVIRVALAALIWSTGGLIVRSLESADVWTTVFWRGVFSAAFLLAYIW